jgi:hypothetical protein
MITSRRNFIKATATASVLGASAARASATSPWICFLHSTSLEPEWQQNFITGLGPNWIADPEASGNNLNIMFHNAGGKYQHDNSSNVNLQNAVKNMIADLQSPPQLFVAAGGIVTALAANGNTNTIPILVIMGRNASFGANVKVGGYYFDNTASGNVTLKAKRDYLHYPYGFAYSKQWLVYNGNSNMGPNEATEWATLVGSANQAIDVSNKGNTTNDKIDMKSAISAAVTAGAEAIVISGDPHFTTKATRIVQYAKNHTGLVMCYPFQEYGDEASDAGLTTNDYMIYGPRLGLVYESLGNLAAKYLTDTTTALSLTLLNPTDTSNPYYTGITHAPGRHHHPVRGHRGHRSGRH